MLAKENLKNFFFIIDFENIESDLKKLIKMMNLNDNIEITHINKSSYDKGSYNFDSGLNPNISDSTNLRKVIRGGSWKDVSYFLRVSTRDYEYKDEKRSYIGFRTVQDYLGEDGGEDRNENKIF